MRKKKKAFTLIELLVVIAIIALLISILLPSLSRARELSKRVVCASNVKGMGTAFKIYANDFEEHWPTIAFSKSATILWTDQVGASIIGQPGDTNIPPSPQTGAQPNRTGISNDTTVTVSVTRNLWMLVRSGDVTPKSYICPSSGDSPRNEQNIDLYYDFFDDDAVSYGYQVPYGPFSTRASEDIDPRMAVAADKGPYSEPNALTTLPADEAADVWDDERGILTPQAWRKFNSGNHGGSGAGEGQNVLFGDGHATFEKTPDVGIDKDNIYTKMGLVNSSLGNTVTPMTSGVRPVRTANSQLTATGCAYPGAKTLEGTSDGSTDSLIYP